MALSLTAILGVVIEEVSSQELEKRIGDGLAQTSVELAEKIDRALYERYQDIRLHTNSLNASSSIDQPTAIENRLNELRFP